MEEHLIWFSLASFSPRNVMCLLLSFYQIIRSYIYRSFLTIIPIQKLPMKENNKKYLHCIAVLNATLYKNYHNYMDFNTIIISDCSKIDWQASWTAVKRLSVNNQQFVWRFASGHCGCHHMRWRRQDRDRGSNFPDLYRGNTRNTVSYTSLF